MSTFTFFLTHMTMVTDQVLGKEISALVSFSGGFLVTWGNLTVHIIEQLPMVSNISLPIIIITSLRLNLSTDPCIYEYKHPDYELMIIINMGNFIRISNL